MTGSLDAPIAALRGLLAGKPDRTPREPGAPRKPREGICIVSWVIKCCMGRGLVSRSSTLAA